MKKLNVTLIFSGNNTVTQDYQGISKRELNTIWRACYTALGFMTNFSDVETILDFGPPPEVPGRRQVGISYEVKTASGEPYSSGELRYAGMDRQQEAILLAAFQDAFVKAGLKWK